MKLSWSLSIGVLALVASSQTVPAQLSRPDADAAIRRTFVEQPETKSLPAYEIVPQQCPYVSDATRARDLQIVIRKFKALVDAGFVEIKHLGDMRTNSIGYTYPPANKTILDVCPDALTNNDHYLQTRSTSPQVTPNTGFQYSSVFAITVQESAKSDLIKLEPNQGTVEGINVKNSQPVRVAHSNRIFSTGTWKFGSVSGIFSAAPNVAQADYIIKFEPTPIGAAFGVKEQTRARSASFLKYDDGWRMAR